MKYETIKNALCDFCEPDNWETSEQYHRYGSYTQYIWTGNNNPMTLAENALDELDTLVGAATCEWQIDTEGEFEDEYYETSCGNRFVFELGTPQKNGYVFCQSCGRRIAYVERS